MSNGTCFDINECTKASPTCHDNDKALELVLSSTLPYIKSCSDIVSYRQKWNKSLAQACTMIGNVLRDAYIKHPIATLCECQCAKTPCKNDASCTESRTDSRIPKGNYNCTCKTGCAFCNNNVCDSVQLV